jgi:mono/diheme cytochrome c family protein
VSLRNNLGVSIFGLVLASMSFVLFSFSSKPAVAAESSSKSGDAHAGEAVFTKNCMQCHVVHEGQTSFGPNLYHELKKPAKKTPAEVHTIIENGKGKMPPWAGKLDAAQINDVIAYLKTL